VWTRVDVLRRVVAGGGGGGSPATSPRRPLLAIRRLAGLSGRAGLPLGLRSTSGLQWDRMAHALGNLLDTLSEHLPDLDRDEARNSVAAFTSAVGSLLIHPPRTRPGAAHAKVVTPPGRTPTSRPRCEWHSISVPLADRSRPSFKITYDIKRDAKPRLLMLGQAAAEHGAVAVVAGRGCGLWRRTVLQAVGRRFEFDHWLHNLLSKDDTRSER
jgi:hypothetical protein